MRRKLHQHLRADQWLLQESRMGSCCSCSKQPAPRPKARAPRARQRRPPAPPQSFCLDLFFQLFLQILVTFPTLRLKGSGAVLLTGAWTRRSSVMPGVSVQNAKMKRILCTIARFAHAQSQTLPSATSRLTPALVACPAAFQLWIHSVKT